MTLLQKRIIISKQANQSTDRCKGLAARAGHHKEFQQNRSKWVNKALLFLFEAMDMAISRAEPVVRGSECLRLVESRLCETSPRDH